jgi:hypothetical protein
VCSIVLSQAPLIQIARSISFGIMKDTFGDDWHWQIDHDQFASLFAYFLFITKGREAPVGDHLAPLGCAGGPSAAPKRD